MTLRELIAPRERLSRGVNAGESLLVKPCAVLATHEFSRLRREVSGTVRTVGRPG